MTDTRDEVERIRAAMDGLPAGDDWYVLVTQEPTGEASDEGPAAHATLGIRGGTWSGYPEPQISGFNVEVIEALAPILNGLPALLDAYDALTTERDALAARLPSPAAVRAARVLAAERIEQWSVHGSPDRAREVANVCADDIRDLADTYSGRHDEGGDVDEPTMLVIAQRVARCTTLGELEEMARELREVE